MSRVIFSLFIYYVFSVIRYVNKKRSFKHIFLHMWEAHHQTRVQYKYSTVSCAVVYTTVTPYISVNLPANLNDNINTQYLLYMGRFMPRFLYLFRRKYPLENAGKGISECLGFKIFWGCMRPHPPRGSRLWRSFAQTSTFPIQPATQKLTESPDSYCVGRPFHLCNWKSWEVADSFC